MEALKMERPMDSWSDERLDELSARVATKDDLAVLATKGELAEVKVELGELKVELGELKVEVGGLKKEVGEVKVELRNLNEKLDRLILVLMASAASLGVTGLATIAGLIATQA